MSTEEKSVWNKICCIFGMLNFLNMGAVKDYIEYNGADTGVRTTFSGKLYVDKKVFFKRTEVRNVINAVINSKELKAHIKISKNKKK
ncbi:hypothetical protein K5L04_06940 [Flavobacterium psychrophilum]|uniref:hypothetical protein n=1 Tax=Flavobacterium psychrophilum TaxID=96345 RepID=UPI001C8F28D9|nr:hypothetical protein [Flavobacterium psychrophilum]QZK99468.1 hypothetical protein K5L04_06940 [Flavobacterium psychrophilum]